MLSALFDPLKRWLAGIRTGLLDALHITALQQLLIEDFLQRHLYSNPRYTGSRRLNRFERQVYSQNGEDGILAEIFARIGIQHHQFVEFGAGDGLENCTAFLLAQGWRGLWLEGNRRLWQHCQQAFAGPLAEGRLQARQAFVSMENIEGLLDAASLENDFDLLCIDIDGNDYWLWKAIERYRPRVVVVEYNALYPPPVCWVRQYNASATWQKNSYFGASLKSLEMLGEAKGYRLVGCNFTGVNAFFVRSELVGDQFEAPFNAENHYEPARYFLRRRLGYPRAFGPSVQD